MIECICTRDRNATSNNTYMFSVGMEVEDRFSNRGEVVLRRCGILLDNMAALVEPVKQCYRVYEKWVVES